jgi:predicted DNA-binding WGR domain protein
MKAEARYFENTTKGHNKFWTIEIDGQYTTTSWGAIGQTPTGKTKDNKSSFASEREYSKTIKSKLAKGYIEKNSKKSNLAVNSEVAKIGKNKAKSNIKNTTEKEYIDPSVQRFSSLEI